MIFTCDAARYGGHQRLVPDQEHPTIPDSDKNSDRHYLSLYLPARTALVLKHSD
jgi:1,4-alpha-glucan branching enzyme